MKRSYRKAERKKDEVLMNAADVKPVKQRFRFSLDTWAVALGLLLAILVRFGAVKHIPW
jgi:hypothetical protein